VTSHEYSPTLDKGAADGPRRNQDALLIARTLTASERWDGETETFIAGEVTAFHVTQDPISNTAYTPAMGNGNKQGCATIGAHTPQGVRRLTPVECERLQGFPDGWTDLGGTPDSKRYAALGDAVTVNVAEWIGRRLMEVAA